MDGRFIYIPLSTGFVTKMAGKKKRILGTSEALMAVPYVVGV